MKKTILLSTLTAAAGLTTAAVATADEAAQPQPAIQRQTTTNITKENVQDYLQAEREILSLISFDDPEDAETAATLKEAVAKFHADFPRALASAAPRRALCPEWLAAALKEEHDMLMILLSRSQHITKETREQFPEVTNACRAIYEPMLLSHPVLVEQEALLFALYMTAPKVENAKMIMARGLGLTEENTFFYRTGFVTGLLKTYPDKLQELVDAIPSEGDQTLASGIVSESLWLVNTEESLAARLSWPSIVTKSSTPTQPDFHHVENIRNNAEESHLLDCAWGYFDATQDEETLKSFILCAVRTQAPENGTSLWVVPDDAERTPLPAEMGDLISTTARWSLHTRAEQNPKFAAKVSAILNTLSAEEQARYNAPFPDYVEALQKKQK